MQSLYEYAVWRDMQNEVTRPGGLAVTAELLELCALGETSRVLDLGCGCAASLRLIKERYGSEIYGLDIARRLLLQAKARPCKGCLVQGNISTMPFTENTFDLILLECVASIFGINEILATCSKYLKVGGKVLLTDLYARKADGLEEVRKLPKGTCIQGVVLQEDIINTLNTCQLKLVHWGDYSQTMNNFPMTTLSASLHIGVIDLVMAANSVDLGFYGVIAEKVVDVMNKQGNPYQIA